MDSKEGSDNNPQEDFIIRKFKSGDEERFAQLHEEVFGTKTTPDFWTWKYLNNPAGQNYIYIAEKDGKFVGQIGAVPINILINNKPVLATQTVDITVKEEFRKAGLFFKLERAATEDAKEHGVKLTYGFAIKLTLKLARRTLGFSENCKVSNISRIYNLTPLLKKRLRIPVIPDLLGTLGNVYFRTKEWRVPRQNKYFVRSISNFDERFSKLFEETNNAEVAISRDHTYLNWRYFDCPSMNYHVFGCFDKDDLKGYCVLSVKESEVNYGHILEFISGLHDHAAFYALMKQVNLFFRTQQVASATCWVPGDHWLYPLLKKAGFVKRDMSKYLIVRSYTDEISNEFLADEKKWFYSLGDSDFYMI